MSAPSPSEAEATLAAAVELFDAGQHLAAHELFEELWEATEGPEADFFKGLLQASVALHHRRAGNEEGARRLHASHRALLARFQPEHRGLSIARFLEEMKLHFRGQPPGARPPPRLGPQRAVPPAG